MNEVVTVNQTKIQVKEYGGRRVVTFKDIDEVHERPEGTARKRFNDNKKYFIEGEDYFKVCASEIRTRKIMNISPKAQEDVTFITESGYLMLVKSFTDETSWKVQRELTSSYFRARQMQADYSALSPQLQFLIQMEQRQKAVETAVRSTNQRINDMCDIMQPVSDDWRPAMNKLVCRIASRAEYPIGELRLDIYDEVDIRGGVHLDTRLEHLRQRMWDRGATETEIDRINKLDVIAQNKKLIAIYIAIVREFAAKYISKQERRQEDESGKI